MHGGGRWGKTNEGAPRCMGMGRHMGHASVLKLPTPPGQQVLVPEVGAVQRSAICVQEMKENKESDEKGL